jgi:hypothetical protein
VYACNRCGKKIGDHNYTVHILRHAFDDMAKVADMTKCKHEYDETEQRIEHLASQHMRCKLCHNLIFQGRLLVARRQMTKLLP